MKAIPETWTMKPLGEVATLQRGFDLPVQDRCQGDVPILAANGPVGTHNVVKIGGPGVVTGRSGTIGKVHYVEDGYWPLNTSLWVKDFHGNDPRWVARLLVWLHLEKHTRGTGVPTLNRNLIHVVPVPLPPLSEQKRIADILDKADAIRRKRQEAIALTEEFLRSAFLEMFGDPVTNPKGWEVRTLGDVLDFKTGKLDANAAVESGRYPFFTCARIPSEIDDYAFDCEALILAGNNASADYWVKHYKGRFNAYQRTYVLSLQSDDARYEYMRQAIELQMGYLKRKSRGTNTKYLTLTILKPIKVQVPPLAVQEKYSLLCAKVEATLDRMNRVWRSSDLFNSLVQRGFRGEL